MTETFKNGYDWEYANWYNQLIIYLFSFSLFIDAYVSSSGRETILYYFVLSTVWVVVGVLNSALMKGWFRHFLGVLVITLNTFIVPFGIYAYGGTIGMAAMIGIAYVMITIVISPFYVGVAAILAGSFFSYLQKRYYVQAGTETDYYQLLSITFAYVMLGLVAFGWRLLIHKLHTFLLTLSQSAPPADSGGGGVELSEYDDLLNEHRLLKEEIAVHILEINDLTGYGKDLAGSS